MYPMRRDKSVWSFPSRVHRLADRRKGKTMCLPSSGRKKHEISLLLLTYGTLCIESYYQLSALIERGTDDQRLHLHRYPGRSVGFTLAGQFSPAYGAVFFNDSHLVLYIEPGKSFDISVKEEGSQIIPAFTGKGAGKNRYLNSEDLRYTPDFELNESEFIAALDKRAENAPPPTRKRPNSSTHCKDCKITT